MFAFFRSSIVTIALLCSLTAGKSADGKELPNIIYILADDLGHGDLGCYGQERIHTPRLDQMAEEGMRFTSHYAGSPVCAPSRCVLMTGKHTGNATRRSNRPYIPLMPDEATVGTVMKNAGYRTGIIGKWGLADTSGDFDPGTTGRPGDCGFDYFYGFLNQKHAWNYYPDFVWENEEQVALNGAHYIHDEFTKQSLEFIERNQNTPFCLFVEHTTPHVNNAFRHTEENLPIPSLGKYADEDWPLIEKKYAAMVTRLDRDVGRILDLLEELGIADNTLVMFSSDNGAQNYKPHSSAFFNSTGGTRGYKTLIYEGGIRAPLLVRWPDVVKAGTVSDHVSAFQDVLPTLAAIAGQPAPDGIDGLSFLPELKGEAQEDHDLLYWEFPTTRLFHQAVRKGDWKAVRFPPNRKIELYNLAEDPSEEKDLAADYPEKVAEFEKLFSNSRSDSEAWPIPDLK